MIVQDLFEAPQLCPECGGVSFSDLILAEKKDACYYKVKASAKVWPSAYASGRLVQCRKKGADNYGNSKNEGVAEAERQPGRFSGAWQILVNGKKVHSFRGNFDQETADRVGVVKAASRGLYNPDSGDKIKIVPVMLNQKQGVAEGYDEDEGNPVMNAIIGRIMRTRPDLLDYDMQKLQAVIRDVALDVGDVDEIGSSDISGWVKRVEQNLSGPGMAEGDNEKIGGRYDPEEFDSMVQRLKKLAGAGPMKTVYDPEKRVYRNMPVAQQPTDKK